MEKSLTDCRTVIVPDAGHAVHLERPDEFAAAISDFLQRPAPE
jgi:pimeloyl-ACP methyl ester carboxylesterase